MIQILLPNYPLTIKSAEKATSYMIYASILRVSVLLIQTLKTISTFI